MDQFVCVRVVQANAMDLSLFQFDYDLTFAAFFMNADRTIYGRYGTQTSYEKAEEISLDGFGKALAAALELHRGYPANRASLAGKQGRPPRFKTPDEYPSLRGKFKPELDYSGKVAGSCMHCHQVRDAERLVFRSARKPIPDEVLYPYPMPEVVGLSLDPADKASVTKVRDGSEAARAGVRPGDELVRLNGQPLLSIADVQWVLHHAADAATLDAEVRRGGEKIKLALELPAGWRRASDISWRVTTWDLRRMGLGGLVLVEASDQERRTAGLSAVELALRVRHVGEYGEHAVAKRAGFQNGDLVIEFDGQHRHMTESGLLAYAVQKTRPGDRVAVTVLRDGKRIELKLPMQ